MSALAKLLEKTKSQTAQAASPANSANRPDAISRISEISAPATREIKSSASAGRSSDVVPEAPVEWAKLQTAADRIERKREARRGKVLAMLEAAPETVR